MRASEPSDAGERQDLRADNEKAPSIADETAICYRCQMRLPVRLTRVVIGPRCGVDALCAACSPEPGPNGEAKRAEVVAMRKARWQR